MAQNANDEQRISVKRMEFRKRTGTPRELSEADTLKLNSVLDWISCWNETRSLAWDDLGKMKRAFERKGLRIDNLDDLIQEAGDYAPESIFSFTLDASNELVLVNMVLFAAASIVLKNS